MWFKMKWELYTIYLNETKGEITYTMETTRYHDLVYEIASGQPEINSMELDELVDYYISIFSLYNQEETLGDKGMAKELQKTVSAFVFFIRQQSNNYNPFTNIDGIAEEIKKLYKYDLNLDFIIPEFEELYCSIEAEMEMF